ncbi:S41 family peptidase [Flavobacteriaceae bacterium S0825]|uniref:S41 family peptidase n=1 Tax=Gaetbulibacter sp. S0825 TaxID=2720084 RepID=UPI001431CCCA|nr:S41 family peptidase [Gaetbulibacter sp. S0825]MCK0109752.1 S41 family peptidase [Flavobacteriaceae bacterium S0825]NIX65384.1 ABC transporter permease subunit [Gaetbulibacter sp. S0825]
MFTNFKIAFIAEHLKKKNTLIYTLGLFFGILSPIILFISRLNGSTRFIPKEPHNMYINYIQNALELFAYYILPFLIILAASRITQLDHKNQGWNLMESLPVRKFNLYFSKFLILLITNTIAIVSFVLLSVCLVFILIWLGKIPEMGLTGIPILFCVNLIIRLLVASLFLSALQYVISVLMSNFLGPIFIGILGFALNTYFNESNIFLSWFPYTPIAMAHNFPSGSEVGNILTYIDYMSLVASIIILYIGFYWFKTKRFAALFSIKNNMLFKTLSALIIFGALFMFVQKTNQFSSHNRTVIQGKIIGNVTVENVGFINRTSRDTLFIPVENNGFKIVISDSLPSTNYRLVFDKKYKTDVFIGANDSIEVDIAIKNNTHSATIKGTRIPENQFLGKNHITNSDYYLQKMIEDSAYYKLPETFVSKLETNYSNSIKAIDDFRTIDNYKAKEDFILQHKKQLVKKHRAYLNDYRAAALEKYHDLKIELPERLQELKEPKITIAEALEDLNEFESILDSKSSYSRLTDYDYKNAIKKLKEKLSNSDKQTITTIVFANEMAKIMAEIGDRHSSVQDREFNSKEYKNYNLRLPFGIAPYDGKFLALHNTPNTYNYKHLFKDYPYIKSINGRSIDMYVNQYKAKKAPIASKLAWGTAAIQNFASFQFHNNEKPTDSVRVTFTNGKSDVEKNIQPIKEKVGFTSKSQIDNYYAGRFMKNKEFGQLIKVIDHNIGYINIPSMLHYEPTQELETFIKTTLNDFSHNTKALIIDVRNNPGGGREILQTFADYIVPAKVSPWVANVAYLRTDERINADEPSMSGRFLYSYDSEEWSNEDRKAIDAFNSMFKTEKEFEASKFSHPFYMVLRNGKTSYTKPVYILANEKSFSAATVFTSAFKGLPNVKTVGVTTDGSSGNSKRFNLKNSNIRVKVSTMLSFQRNGKTLDGNGTEPDIYIPIDLEQIFTGKDTQLEKLVKIINNSRI